MLTKKESIEIRRILEDGRIQYRTRTDVYEDGKFLARKYKPGYLAPGQDTSKLPASKVLDDIKPGLWTQERVKAWDDKHGRRRKQ
jgi:hypothetical protein